MARNEETIDNLEQGPLSDRSEEEKKKQEVHP